MMKCRTASALFLLLPYFAVAELPRYETPVISGNKETAGELNREEVIRICTWNIEWFPAGQRKGRAQETKWQTAAVANLIHEIRPDILLTQETRNLQVLEQLNRNLNPPRFTSLASSWFYKENPSESEDSTAMGDQIQQQCGILSRIPWVEGSLREIDFAPLPNPRPARGWLAAQFKAGGHEFTIYNGHLKSNYGAEDEKTRLKNYQKRLDAITYLEADLKKNNLDPYRDKIIVVGDFNTNFYDPAFSDEKTLRALMDLGFKNTFIMASKEERTTTPAREGEPWPDATFDYIWVSSGWKASNLNAAVLQKGASKRIDVFGGDEPGLASDHYPVYLDIPTVK